MATGLSYAQKNALRASWARFRENAVANGVGFYLSLFKTYPDTLPPFKPLLKDVGLSSLSHSPAMKAQSIVFCDEMSSFIDRLDDVEVLVQLVRKMAKLHFGRGLREKEMREGFEVLVRYLQDNCGAGRGEWEQFTHFLLQTMADEMRALS